MYVSSDGDACYVSQGGEDANICIHMYIHICDADVWRHVYLLSCFMCCKVGNICIRICICMYIFTYEYISRISKYITGMIFHVCLCTCNVYMYLCVIKSLFGYMFTRSVDVFYFSCTYRRGRCIK